MSFENREAGIESNSDLLAEEVESIYGREVMVAEAEITALDRQVQELLDGPNAHEQIESAQVELAEAEDVAVEAIIESNLSVADLSKTESSMEEMIEEIAAEGATDTIGTGVENALERRYKTSLNVIYRAFKGLGGQALILNAAEMIHNGYQAAVADSRDERQQKLKDSWRAFTKINPLALIPEAIYRAGKYVSGNKEEKALQKKEMNTAMKEDSFGWKWLTGSKGEKSEMLDVARTGAMVASDIARVGAVGMYGLSKEAILAGKEVTAVSGIFRKSFEDLREKVDRGDSVSAWEAAKEIVRAGMKATGKNADQVMTMIGRELGNGVGDGGAEKQKGTMRLVAEVLKSEKGRERLLKSLEAIDEKIEKKKTEKAADAAAGTGN